MKSASIFAFVLLIFTTVHAQEDPNDIASKMANAFSIDKKEAERCIHNVGVTADDFEILATALTHNSAELNKESIRKASCAAVCGAQVQGTMTGAKIEIQTIRELVRSSKIPPNMLNALLTNIDTCHNRVKDITDECDLGYRFLKCVIRESWDLGLFGY